MPNSKAKVLIVDDSPQDLQLLLGELKDNYLVTAAASADDALQILREQDLPDIILMDVNMPGTNGYQACNIIKEDSKLREIDVIFLSANDTTDEIIQGLDAGAIDYVVKPYDPDVLQSKLKRAFDSAKARKQLIKQASDANQMAYSVMVESGSLGNILSFFRTSFGVETPRDLALETVNALSQQDLVSVVLFSAGPIREVEGSSGMPSMLEIELLERLIDHPQPFVEKGERCFVIQKDIVVLIKNMPLDDVKRGSKKDLIKTLLEGTSAKLQYFVRLSAASSAKMKKLAAVIEEAKTALDDQRRRQEEHKRKSLAIMDDMYLQVEESFLTLGLTEEQEQGLLNIISSSVNETIEHMERGLKLDEKMQDVVLKLAAAAHDAAQ